MVNRNISEWVGDHLLLLFICDIATNHKQFHKTRIQKSIFLSQYELWGLGYGSFNYNFIRFNYGPYSSEVNSDIDHLRKNNLLNYLETSGYFLQPKGNNLLDQVKHIFERNRKITDRITTYVGQVMMPSFDEMLERIYRKPNPLNPKISIEDTPQKKYLLSRDVRPKDLISFELTESELEDLETIFDPELWKQYQKGEISTKSSPLVSWN